MYNFKITPLVVNEDLLHNKEIEISKNGSLYDVTCLVQGCYKVIIKHYFYNEHDYKIIYLNDECISVAREKAVKRGNE